MTCETRALDPGIPTWSTSHWSPYTKAVDQMTAHCVSLAMPSLQARESREDNLFASMVYYYSTLRYCGPLHLAK